MFNEKVVIEQLTLLQVPTSPSQVRFDPTDSSVYTGNGYPSMYLLNAPLKSYFYSTEVMCFLSLDVNEEISYNFSWWFAEKKFAVSFIDVSEMFSNDTVPIRLSDSLRIGVFHDSEEDHFQNDCMNGSPLSWKSEQLFQKKLGELTEFYTNHYYSDFLKRGK